MFPQNALNQDQHVTDESSSHLRNQKCFLKKLKQNFICFDTRGITLDSKKGMMCIVATLDSFYTDKMHIVLH